MKQDKLVLGLFAAKKKRKKKKNPAEDLEGQDWLAWGNDAWILEKSKKKQSKRLNGLRHPDDGSFEVLLLG